MNCACGFRTAYGRDGRAGTQAYGDAGDKTSSTKLPPHRRRCVNKMIALGAAPTAATDDGRGGASLNRRAPVAFAQGATTASPRVPFAAGTATPPATQAIASTTQQVGSLIVSTAES